MNKEGTRRLASLISSVAIWASPALVMAGGSGARALEEESGASLFIRAERLIVRPGRVLENAQVIVRDGQITAVGSDLDKPEGAREIQGRTVCAGFIDAWSALGVAQDALVDPNAGVASRTVDALDLYSDEHLRREALRAGVTSVRVQAGARALSGGVGSVLRLHPSGDHERSMILEDATLSMSVGLSDSRSAAVTEQVVDGVTTVSDSGTKRRIDIFDRVDQADKIASKINSGLRYLQDTIEYRFDLEEWKKATAEKEEKLEKDFKKAKKARTKAKDTAEEKGKEFKEKKYKEDKKPKAPKYDADKEVLGRAANGELVLVVQANRVAELKALLSKTEGLDRLRMVVAGGTEALAVADELASRSIPVLVWPALRGSAQPDEFEGHDLALAGRLNAKGVTVLLGSGGLQKTASRDLPMLASLAVGHGLEAEAAFEALTLGAARALDISDRVGSLERGKDADILVLDGDPLVSTTRVRYVIAGGDVVVSPED